jgi:hypothetical protein
MKLSPVICSRFGPTLPLAVLLIFSCPQRAFPLGLEIELGGQLGVEKYESRTKIETAASETNSTDQDINSPLFFGARFDPRLLFIQSRNLHVSAGVGLGLDFGSADATVNETQIEISHTRIRLEPNARFLFLTSKSFGIGAGLGYCFGLSGTTETKISSNGTNVSTKVDVKDDSGFRLRLSMAAVLSGAHRPQIVGSYQLTTGGTFRVEESTTKLDLSGHAFVLSYVHPIQFDKDYSDEDDAAEYEMNRANGRRDRNPGILRNNRKRRPQPRG